MRTTGIFILLYILTGFNLAGLHAATAIPALPHPANAPAYGVAGTPLSSPIPALTIFAGSKETLTVNGSFDAGSSRLSYTARLADGGSLPSWISFDSATGTFTFNAPNSAVGQLYRIKVSAKDGSGAEASESFYLNVDNSSFSCTVDANTDGLARMLNCTTGRAKLRGYSSSGSYRWTGPNGFTSSQEEPEVSAPGLYTLTTSGSDCPRRSIVEVLPSSMGCSGGKADNKIPTGNLKADRTTGNAPLNVNFDATASRDDDGKIVDYLLSWEGGSASGAKPTVTFPEGSHDVTLTITDNTGARSTDRLNISSRKAVDLYSFWLEAECATVGSKWSTVSDNSASGQKYVTAKSDATSGAPADAPENRIRFMIDNVVQADYSLFARIDAKDKISDSYWVRVNGGSWYEWNSGISNTGGFQWNEAPLSLSLRAGSNTVDFAFRESDTRLDKILITTGANMPSGTGDAATNCVSNKAPVAKFTATPNSGTGPLNVSLDASASSDADGSIQRYDWAWNGGGSGTGVRPQITLNPGSYRVTLTVTDNDGARDSDVVAIEVNSPTPTTGAQNSYWMEAECAEVGSRWSTVSTSSASGSKYVVVKSGTSYNSAPTDRPENYVRFSVSSAAAGNYALFARIDAANGYSDSYWVRVNEGSWISWSSGIEQRKGFQWNKLRNSLKLNAGDNTVDFAYRESNTKLDKIFLTSTGNRPSGLGSEASNCGGATNEQVDVWMEAECASLGGDWYNYPSSASSGGSYIAFTGPNNTTSPSSDVNQQVKFNVSVAQNGTYHLFMRLDAMDRTRNSFWVRMDGGSWINFRKEKSGDELLTQGTQWREVTHDGRDVTFNLSAGNHTITIANREAGTRLDKIALSSSAALPEGMGGKATNCGSTAQPITSFSNATQSTTTTGSELEAEEVMPAESQLSVFPNPAVSDLNVQLSGTYEGRVDVYIIDATGRTLSELHFDKAGDQLQTPVDVSNLPAGMYHLRVIEGDQQLVKPFIKR